MCLNNGGYWGYSFHEFKIRQIPQQDWDLFLHHCREESLNRGKTISANKRLVEMIKMVSTTVSTNQPKQSELFKEGI